MSLQGKGFFCDDWSACEGGDPVAVLSAARAAGLTHLVIKIADGPRPAGLDASGADRLPPFVSALQQGGLKVWGSHVVRGADPAAEAQAAVGRLQALGVDGFVVRPAGDYQLPGRERAARVYMYALKSAAALPLALSAFRFPQYHPDFPWSAFLESCDLHMPQVFWEAAHDAGAQLRESKRQCDGLPGAKPFVPVAATYGPSGRWSPTQADLADFLDAVCHLDLPIVDFFSWEGCRANLPELWGAVSAFQCPTGIVPAAGLQPAASVPQDAEPAGMIGMPEPPADAEPAGMVAMPTPPADAEPAGMIGMPEPPADAEPAGTAAVPAQAPVPPPPPSSPAVDDFAVQFLAALSSRQPARVAALYASGALCVRGERILHGTTEIQGDYATFFAELPLDAEFSLVQAQVSDSEHKLAWKAGERTVLSTLVVEAGKITQDYTHLGA